MRRVRHIAASEKLALAGDRFISRRQTSWLSELPRSRMEKARSGTPERRRAESLRFPLMLLLMSLGAIATVWLWLGTPVILVRAPIDPNDKAQCISYAPFRSHQTSLSSATQVSGELIAEDLAQLAKITDCIRTYATDLGLDQSPSLPPRRG